MIDIRPAQARGIAKFVDIDGSRDALNCQTKTKNQAAQPKAIANYISRLLERLQTIFAVQQQRRGIT